MRPSRAATARLIAAVLGVGCASQPPSPFFQDERYLVLGVDADAETDALARQLEASGFSITRRLRGQHFSALGAAGKDGLPAKVRVVTARGIALALDPDGGVPAQPGRRFALLPPPSSETHDADGDGFEEVFVQVLPVTGESCIEVYRVRDSGFVDDVTSGGYTLPPAGDGADAVWKQPSFCVGPAPEDAGSPQTP